MIELIVKLLFSVCLGVLFFIVFNKRINFIFYFIFFIIVFFPELGPGFSSFNGSFFFNQNSLNFANFKIIDLFVITLFICSQFKTKDKVFKNSPIDLPIKIMSFYIIVLLGVDYINHEYFDFGSIRRQLSLVLLYFSFVRLLNNKNIIYLNKILLIMLASKCLINITQFMLGYGVHSIRGSSTIFWDSGLIYGLGIFCVCLFSFIINKKSFFNRNITSFMFLFSLLMLLFAWRRNTWLSLILGFIIVILNAKLINKIIGMYFILFSIFILSVCINLFPNLPLSKYTKSMNLFNEESFYDRSNQVHIENVLGYYNLLSENPQIWFFGLRGILDEDYKNINKWEEYNLGTPHNAIFAKIFNEGILSVFLYCWMHLSFIRFCLISNKKNPNLKSAYIIGIVGFMLAHFILTLMVIPPETTFKGTFFIIFFMLTCIIFINTVANKNSLEGK